MHHQQAFLVVQEISMLMQFALHVHHAQGLDLTTKLWPATACDCCAQVMELLHCSTVVYA
jgi:hypothetical protein